MFQKEKDVSIFTSLRIKGGEVRHDSGDKPCWHCC